MKNLNLLFFATLLTSVLLSGCEKDDDNYQPSAKKLLPLKIEYDWRHPDPSSTYSTVYTFTYDSQNRITAYEMVLEDCSGDRTVFINTLSYVGDDIIENRVRVEPYSNYTVTYQRKGSQIQVEDREPILIDNKLRLAGPHYDGHGNAIRHFSFRCQYDQENGIFRHVNMPPWYITYSLTGMVRYCIYNNCVKEVADNVGYYYDIDYNADDYPASVASGRIGSTTGEEIVDYKIEYIEAN